MVKLVQRFGDMQGPERLRCMEFSCDYESDVDDLPVNVSGKPKTVLSRSFAYIIENSKVYMFSEAENKWIKQQ